MSFCRDIFYNVPSAFYCDRLAAFLARVSFEAASLRFSCRCRHAAAALVTAVVAAAATAATAAASWSVERDASHAGRL